MSLKAVESSTCLRSDDWLTLFDVSPWFWLIGRKAFVLISLVYAHIASTSRFVGVAFSTSSQSRIPRS